MANYCFTDLHGRYELWKQIKDYIKPEDKVYCLGDCIDRGRWGLPILLEVLEHPQVTFLLGNHEDFLLNFVPEFFNGNMKNYELWCDWNGGLVTWDDITQTRLDTIMYLLEDLKDAPLHIELTNENGKKIYLSHSGYDPWEIPLISLKGRKEKDIYTWDRIHFKTNWTEASKYYDGFFDFENSYIIHGHTPVQKFTGWKDDYHDEPELYDPRVYHYADGHKIDLDLCSIESNRAVLFNLDTFEEVYFECEENDLQLP